MKESFKRLALALALTPAFAGVSASASAVADTGTVSATVVAPAHTGNLDESVAISTGITGDLTIRIPGLLQPAIPSEHLNSVPFELSRVLESGCRNAGVLTDCLALKGEHGLLQGDPVHNILVNFVAHGTSGEDSVSLTLSYN
jgi:hypothetical protein